MKIFLNKSFLVGWQGGVVYSRRIMKYLNAITVITSDADAVIMITSHMHSSQTRSRTNVILILSPALHPPCARIEF